MSSGFKLFRVMGVCVEGRLRPDLALSSAFGVRGSSAVKFKRRAPQGVPNEERSDLNIFIPSSLACRLVTPSNSSRPPYLGRWLVFWRRSDSDD